MIENDQLRRICWYNGGALQGIQLFNKVSKQTIAGTTPPARKMYQYLVYRQKERRPPFRTYPVAATNNSYGFLAAEVVLTLGTLSLKRVCKNYAWQLRNYLRLFVKGAPGKWGQLAREGENFQNIEKENTGKAAAAGAVITDKIALTGNHWSIKKVKFFDATDYINNLVQEYERLIYRQETKLGGNLLFAVNQQNQAGFFILKEAPVSGIQLAYLGFDFTTKLGEVKVAGIGLSPENLVDTFWKEGYSVTIGINEATGMAGRLQSLRNFQQRQRLYKPGRDAMIVVNTWGDRSQDSRINEDFILQELEAAAKLGVTHYQVDDGWQVGISSNSTLKGSLKSIRANPHY